MQRPTKTIFGLFAASLAACAFASTGCTAPMKEQIGSRTEKLLAPEAILTTHASALTKSQLGIAKWKVFRGKSDYVLTGYDDEGKAVKGISFTWSAGSSKTMSAPVLKARVLDGTRAAMRHTFDGSKKSEANKTLSKSTRMLLARATFDMGAAGTAIFGKQHGGKTPPPGYFGEGFPGGGTSPAPTTPAPTTPSGGTTPFPPDDPFGGMGYPGGDPTGGMDPGACGMDMSSMIMSALQCLMSGALGGGTTGGTGGAGSLMMCIQAAAAGAGIGGSCADPTGGAGPMDPTGGGMDPTGGGPYGDLGGASDPYGSGAADQAGGPMSCMSCPEGGGYGDIGMDPSNGDVYGGGAPGGGYGPESGFGAGW